MQNSVMSTWITCLYVSQLSSVVFACKTAHFGPELQVSMGPRPHLSFKTSTFGSAYKSLWVPGITCPFVLAKQRDEHLNYLSLCVPALICGFCMQNSVLRAKIACLYRSQSSHVIFCIQISDFSTWNTSLYWSQPSCVVFACKTATSGPEKQISMSPRHNPFFCACKTAWFAPELLVSMGYSPHL